MKNGKRLFALLMAVCMAAGMLPVFASAAECEHHQTHTPECGYAEDVENSCTFACELCGEDSSNDDGGNDDGVAVIGEDSSNDGGGEENGLFTEVLSEDAPMDAAPHTHTFTPWDVYDVDEWTSKFFRTCTGDGCEAREESENPPEPMATMLAGQTPEADLQDAVANQVLTQEAADKLLEALGMVPTADPVATIGTQGYASLAEAIAAAGDGDTIVLADGTHTMPSSVANKNITIKGGKNAVVEMLTAVGANGSAIAFEGVTAKFDNDGYEGLQHSTKVSYTNCTIYGTQFLYAPTVSFSGCTFEKYNASTEYNVWTYGSSNVSFSNCVFNSSGKAILVYTEGAHTATINVANCTFNSDGTYTGKAAVEVGQSANGAEAHYTVNVSGSAATGFTANNSDSPLVGNKDSMGYKDFVANVDGVEITKPAVAVTTADGTETGYDNLKDALNAAKAAQADPATSGAVTIEILEDLDLSGWTAVEMPGMDFTLDGNGKTITGLSAPLVTSTGSTSRTDNKATFKDLTISGANISGADAAGALVGWANENTTLTASNVAVVNSSVASSGFSGGLVGYLAGYSSANISGCSVTGTTISGATVGGMVGLTNGNASVSGTVGGNTLKGESAAKEGAVIGTLTGSAGNTMSVTEQSQSTGDHGTPPYIIGRLYQPVTYTGGSYYNDPQLKGDGEGVASPDAGYAFVENANGTFGLAALPDGGTGSVDDIEIVKTITIKWDDSDNKRGARPEKVIVNLYKDGKFDREIEMKANADGSWSRELTLKAYENAKEIPYTVKQDAVSGYTTSYSADTFAITNTIKPLTAYSYSATKLLQTGPEVLPIGLMVMAGIFAMAASLWLLRKKHYER